MKDLLPAKTNVSPPAPADYAAYAPQDAYGEPPQGSPIKLGRLLYFLKRFWWLPLLTLILGLGAAGAYVYYTPPIYVSYGRMWETEKLRLPDGAAFIGDLQNYYGTQMELLQSGRLLSQALARLQETSSNAIPKDATGQPLDAKVKVRQMPKSTIFLLELTSGNANYSQALLNALMNEYLLYKKTVRKNISGDTLSSISDQVLRLERDLKADQETFAAFQKTNNLAILQEEATTSGGYLARLKTQLSDLELEARLLEASAIQQTNSLGTNMVPLDPLRLTSSSGASSAVAESHVAFKELELLKIRRDKLSRYLKDKHPKIVKLDSEIDRGHKIAELYRNQSRDQLASARQAIALKLESVRTSIKEWETKVVDFKGIIAEAERLKVAVTRSQSLYDRLVAMLQNVDISRSIDQETLAILEPATPAERSQKQEIGILGAGGMFGLGLGLGLVFLIQFRDDRFASVREVTETFGNGVMGQVPEVQFNGSGPLQLKDQEQEHMYAESYRNIRSALLYTDLGANKPKTILVTSALPGEGKSTVAVNLAKTLALGGAHVLLVDGDLRKGGLHALMGLNQAPGFTELLRDSVGPRDVLQTNSLPNLRFIAAGKRISNAGDLFIGKPLDALLHSWRDEFDHIVIDSTPVFAADDASTLAPKMDGVVLVVRNRFSKSAQVKEALELLVQRQAKVLGIVYNRANAKSSGYQYYQYKEYYAGQT